MAGWLPGPRMGAERASERARALVLLVAAEWEAAATCFPKREAESREVCAVSVSPGAGAPHRTPTWPCPDTWRAAGRWIETGIRGQEAAGMFWKSEAEGPRPADVSVPRGGRVAGIGARRRRVGGPVAGRRGRRRFDQRPAPHPRIKEC